MLVGLFSHYFFGIGIFLTSMFLVMLVLVQRGRGGGIAGALGGAGGQSAFGTKAGDLFTRITVGVATFWILLCCAAILTLKERGFSTGIEKQQAQSGAASSGAGAAEKSGDAGATNDSGNTGESGNSGEADAASGSQESSPPAAAPSGDSANPSSGAAAPATASQETASPDTGDGPVATEPPTDGVSPEVNELDSDSAVSTPDE